MKLFGKSKNKAPERIAENSEGDFYVEDGVCTSCGAPQAEAPDLIDHSKFAYGHCYFKKQPQTEEEIKRAINAIAVSCISGLRYGGTNEKILKRLHEIGQGEQCDHIPVGNYKTIIWDKVIFLYSGSIKELCELVTNQLVLGETHLNKQVSNLKLDNDHFFEFTYRWTSGATGNIFKCYFVGDSKYRIEMYKEANGYEISIRGNAMILNAILCSDKNVSEIIWFDQDNNVYSETELQ